MSKKIKRFLFESRYKYVFLFFYYRPMTSINNNASIYAQQSLIEAQNSLTTAISQLSTGKRVNAAQDDAASLAISQNLISQIKTINQSISNLNSATNVMQIADSGLNSIQDMVLRIKDLAIMGTNESLSRKLI